MPFPIERFLVDRSAPLKAVMRQLEETEERILFVVEDGVLFGAISDGDIRRWILADGSLEASAEQVCNRDPLTVGQDFTTEEVVQLMSTRNVTCIPVVNQARRPVELLFASQVFKDLSIKPLAFQTIDVPVVIMAGGKGTRLDPFTRILPKPLLPIGDKAVIEVIIESFTKHGISQFMISINHKGRLVRSFFEELNPPYRLKYILEDEPRGTAGALRNLRGHVNGSLIVTNCDIIIRADFADIVRTHEQSSNDITVVVSMRSYAIPYGVCELVSGGLLGRIVEKPQYDMLVNTGMYVLNSQVLDAIPERGVFHATDLIAAVKAAGGRVGVYPISEKSWLDTGEWAQYREAVRMLGLPGAADGSARGDSLPEFREERRLIDRAHSWPSR